MGGGVNGSLRSSAVVVGFSASLTGENGTISGGFSGICGETAGKTMFCSVFSTSSKLALAVGSITSIFPISSVTLGGVGRRESSKGVVLGRSAVRVRSTGLSRRTIHMKVSPKE